jgi:hypothetical protein
MAERTFRDAHSREPIIARMYVPEKLGEQRWSCRIEIEGLDQPFTAGVSGTDSFQALYLGLLRLCKHLQEHENHLVFLDGEATACSFPLIMPWDFGAPLRAEVYRLIEQKILEHLKSE